jgi:hypothetical protein
VNDLKAVFRSRKIFTVPVPDPSVPLAFLRKENIEFPYLFFLNLKTGFIKTFCSFSDSS